MKKRTKQYLGAFLTFIGLFGFMIYYSILLNSLIPMITTVAILIAAIGLVILINS